MAEVLAKEPAGSVTGRWRVPVAALAVQLLFLVFAAWCGYASWPHIAPYTPLAGDAANIAGFAAVRLAPDNFAHDGLLSDPGNVAFYRTFHTWACHVAGLYFDDIGFAFVPLYPVTIFLFLSGYWLLFRSLGLTIAAATIAAAGMLVTVDAMPGDYWGGFWESQPRFLYAALMPFAVLPLLGTPIQSYRVVVSFLLLGLFTYVHPVSGPAVAFALWCGLAYREPHLFRRPTDLIWLVGAGVCFVAVIVPFAWSYMAHTAFAARPPMSPDIAAAYLRGMQNFYGSYLNVPQSILRGFLATWGGARVLVLIGAAVFIGFALRHRGSPQHPLARFAVGTAAGLGITSLLFPLIDYGLAFLHGGVPVQLDLVRNVRYFIPLVLVTCFYGMYLGTRSLSSKTWVPTLGLLVIATYWYAANVGSPYRWQSPLHALETAITLRDDKAARAWIETARHDAEIARWARRNTSPLSSFFFATDNTLTERRFRYAALRSVVYSVKDWGSLGYSNPRAFVEWLFLYERLIKPARESRNPVDQLRLWRAAARERNADFIILPPQLAALARQEGQAALFASGPYAVYRLTP